ncbi:MAG: DNA topoisomerase I [Candidatus Thorarchaeota archaeon]|nr:MAG: DNA topoisomerase I [Candidatus Thorarchaeota archaeon]
MESLVHNGILVIDPPAVRGLKIRVRGNEMVLSQLQEEMALAWVRKLGTPYVEDPVFAQNFMKDFSKALGVKPALQVTEIDFYEIIRVVEEERARKEHIPPEEKRAQREEKKALRDSLKEKYGYASVDGVRMELGNYQTEPSGIFMGRGKHPLRGRWKQGTSRKDITLNIDPQAAKTLEGEWKELIWAPDTMWVAKWTDELTGKVKYIWLHDSTPIKQERESAKFDKALQVERRIDEIRNHIMEGLRSDNPKRRMVAAACYLIDNLSLRVGDEKDPDEADTVGATTLRAEHLIFKKDSIVFDFLGKDSVPWHKEMTPNPDVYNVLKELHDSALERIASFEGRRGEKTGGDPKRIAKIFPTIDSTHVNRFLSEVYPELTAKVFRTYHASTIMREELKMSKAKKTDPEFIKKEAFRRANLEVARVMNHTKQAPQEWNKSASRYLDRIKKAEAKVQKAMIRLTEKKSRLRRIKKNEADARAKKQDLNTRKKAVVEKNKASMDTWREKRDKAKLTWDHARDQKSRTRTSRRKGKTTKKERLEDAQERIDRTRMRLQAAESNLVNARERYQKSKTSLEGQQQSLAEWRESSAKRIAAAEKGVEIEKERVGKAELAKRKIEIDYELARDTRTWNLGTSLKSYVHPKIVYNWSQRVDYDWKKVYSTTLQRKFEGWIDK